MEHLHSGIGRNGSFKICLILSAFIHISVLYPWPFLDLAPSPEITFKKIELTYFREGAIKDLLIKDIGCVTSLNERMGEDSDIQTANLEKIKIDVKKETSGVTEVKKELSSEPEPQPAVKEKGASAKNDSLSEDARLDYCLKVREKIKSILERNKTRFAQEGEVYVKFIVMKDGSLKNLSLYKSLGMEVRFFEKIAVESVKEASPFPPFTEEMGENELLFKLPIRFTCNP